MKDLKKTIIDDCAKICGKPFYKLAPSCIDIDPKSHEPVDSRVSQRQLFSFINDVIKIRANKILDLKNPCNNQFCYFFNDRLKATNCENPDFKDISITGCWKMRFKKLSKKDFVE